MDGAAAAATPAEAPAGAADAAAAAGAQTPPAAAPAPAPPAPKARVALFPDAVSPATLAGLRRAADGVAAAPNFWVPRARIEAGRAACRTAADVAVLELFARHMAGRLPPNWAGAEYWCQVYKPHAGLAFHFDKDEHLLAEEGRVVTPAWSSVLYLTGTPQDGGRREGPTLVIDQVYNQAAGRPLPAEPSAATLVFPAAGAYLAFDGGLAHGVLDGFAATQRATLLVNWWDHQPQAVLEATDAQLAEFGIPLLPAAAGEGGGDDNKGDDPTEALAAAMSGAAIGGGSEGGEGGGVAIPEVVAPDAAGLDRAVMIDALIAEAGLRLSGPGAASAVRVCHPGLVLMPVDPQQIMAQEAAAAAAAGRRQGAGGEGAEAGAAAPPPMQTAAVLLPPCLVASSSDEEEESGSGGGSESGSEG